MDYGGPIRAWGSFCGLSAGMPVAGRSSMEPISFHRFYHGEPIAGVPVFVEPIQDSADLADPFLEIPAEEDERDLADEQIGDDLFLEDLAIHIPGTIPGVVIRDVDVAEKCPMTTITASISASAVSMRCRCPRCNGANLPNVRPTVDIGERGWSSPQPYGEVRIRSSNSFQPAGVRSA